MNLGVPGIAAAVRAFAPVMSAPERRDGGLYGVVEARGRSCRQHLIMVRANHTARERFEAFAEDASGIWHAQPCAVV
jgi:hypothetical protein